MVVVASGTVARQPSRSLPEDQGGNDGPQTAKRSGIAKMSDYITNGVWDGFKPPPLPED